MKAREFYSFMCKNKTNLELVKKEAKKHGFVICFNLTGSYDFVGAIEQNIPKRKKDKYGCMFLVNSRFGVKRTPRKSSWQLNLVVSHIEGKTEFTFRGYYSDAIIQRNDNGNCDFIVFYLYHSIRLEEGYKIDWAKNEYKKPMLRISDNLAPTQSSK